MSRFLGPKLKIVRRLGFLPGLTNKKLKHRIKTPGQHGKTQLQKKKRSSLSDDFGERLVEKQKVRYNYGLTEKQLYTYFQKAKHSIEPTSLALFKFLEARLDCILYRIGFAPTIPAARQIITHGHIIVNNCKVTIPSFLCKKNDLILVQKRNKSEDLVRKNLLIQIQKREILQRKLQKLNVLNYHFAGLLPQNFCVDHIQLQATILANTLKQESCLKIDTVKVIEFYSK
jgi:small subunit ribosomal protein S4